MRRKRDFTNGNNRKERLRKVREGFPEKKTFFWALPNVQIDFDAFSKKKKLPK